MPQKSSFKLSALYLSLLILFLLAVLGTAVSAQKAQPTAAPIGPPEYTPAVGHGAPHREPKHPALPRPHGPLRGPVAYTPVVGISMPTSPDPDGDDQTPQATPTPGTDATPIPGTDSLRPRRYRQMARNYKHGTIRPQDGNITRIDAGKQFVVVIQTENSYSEHVEWDPVKMGMTKKHREVFDPFVTVKLFRADGTQVVGYNQQTDQKLNKRLRLTSGEQYHTLPLYGKFSATDSLFKYKKEDKTIAATPLTTGDYVIHIYRHLAYGGSEVDQNPVTFHVN